MDHWVYKELYCGSKPYLIEDMEENQRSQAVRTSLKEQEEHQRSQAVRTMPRNNVNRTEQRGKESTVYESIHCYLSKGSYPQSSTKAEKGVIRSWAKSFSLVDGILHYKGKDGQLRQFSSRRDSLTVVSM